MPIISKLTICIAVHYYNVVIIISYYYGCCVGEEMGEKDIHDRDVQMLQQSDGMYVCHTECVILCVTIDTMVSV